MPRNRDQAVNTQDSDLHSTGGRCCAAQSHMGCLGAPRQHSSQCTGVAVLQVLGNAQAALVVLVQQGRLQGKLTSPSPTQQQVSRSPFADVEPEPPHCSCTCLACLQVLGDYKATLAALVQQGKLLRKEAADRRAQLASFDSDHDKATAEKTHAERALRRLKDDQQDT